MFANFEMRPWSAAVIIAALLVVGAVLIWAPDKSVEALVGLAGTITGALVPALVGKKKLSSPSAVARADAAQAGQTTSPPDSADGP